MNTQGETYLNPKTELGPRHEEIEASSVKKLSHSTDTQKPKHKPYGFFASGLSLSSDTVINSMVKHLNPEAYELAVILKYLNP